MNKETKKGFTLIELLITIAIVSIAFSISFFVINNLIDKMNETSRKTSEKNILEASRIYVEEFNDSLDWKSNDEETMSCVPMKWVIDNGLLKKEDIVKEYEDYTVKVIKSNDKVNEYKILESVDCKLKDTIPPTITAPNATVEIKTDYDVMTDVVFNGTGTNIVREEITYKNQPITNTKDLSLGEHILLYEIEDEGGHSVTKERKITIIDSVAPDVQLTWKPTESNSKWVNKDVELKGIAEDLGSGLSSYSFTQTKESSNVTNWNNLSEIEKGIEKIEKTHNISIKGKWYFHAKDLSGKTSKKEVELFIDKVAPTYSSKSGSFYSNSVPIATFTDADSGVKTVKYLVISGTSSTPEKTHSGFTTNSLAKKTLNCGTYYYAYAVAEDNAGNLSDVKKIGEYYDSCYVYVEPEPTCDWLCQMNKNQNNWHNTNNTNSQDNLHQSNDEIAKENCPSCTYNDDTGKWYYEDGKELPIYGDDKK